MFSSIKFLTSLLPRKKRGKQPHCRRQAKSAQLRVEMLETRVVPIIGALALAPSVLPGTNLDGVVQLLPMRGSGSELANQTEILTAAHVVLGNPDMSVNFNLQRAGNAVNIQINIPGIPANFVFPEAPLAYNPATDANDIAVVNLTDSLALPPGLPANLRLIAPFSPFESGYSIVPLPGAPAINVANQNGPTFTMVGYGRQGTGAGGQVAVAPPVGTKTVGANSYDQMSPTDPNMLLFDFDDGLDANNQMGGLGVGQTNALPWTNEAMPGSGDSGGPGLIGTVGNGSALAGGAGNILSIVGVESWGTGNGEFGTIGGQVLANTYDQPAAGANPAGFIWTARNNTPYGAILDMRTQVLGLTANAAGIQDPLTITVERGTAAGVFQPGGPTQPAGPNLLIKVTDTAQPAYTQYNGIYFNQPVDSPDGAQMINSLVLRGNDGGDTFQLIGNLGVGPITILGGAGANTIEIGADGGGTLDDVSAPITIDGGTGANNTLVVNDVAANAGRNYDLLPGTVQWGAAQGTIQYVDINALTLNTGNGGANTIIVGAR